MALAGLQEEKKNDVKMAEHAYNEMYDSYSRFTENWGQFHQCYSKLLRS